MQQEYITIEGNIPSMVATIAADAFQRIYPALATSIENAVVAGSTPEEIERAYLESGTDPALCLGAYYYAKRTARELEGTK
jgi:hypothetical protein